MRDGNVITTTEIVTYIKSMQLFLQLTVQAACVIGMKDGDLFFFPVCINNLILIVTCHLNGYKILFIFYNLCCLRHDKVDVKNVSSHTMFYLKFVNFKVI